MSQNRMFFAVVAVVAIGLAVIALRSPPSDGLDAFPHAFLSRPGYDPAAIEVIVAPLARPPHPPADSLPAWICDDTAFADAQGRLWLFPMARAGSSEPQPPLHPVLGRRPDQSQCRPFLTAEAQAMIDAFRERVKP
jgi:hypothetical protein